MNDDNMIPTNEEVEEEWKAYRDRQWRRYQEQWRATYKRHHSYSGWATLGAEVRDGICHCPVCQLVREMDKL